MNTPKLLITSEHGTLDVENKYIYFWSGVFSQWHKSKFFNPHTGTEYNTAEQAMMHHKALVFSDTVIADQIIAEQNPQKQKELGRKVRGYVDSVWNDVRYNIVRDISVWKFSQSNELKTLMVMLKGWTFVEASPEDPIWGVGLAENDPRILDSANWKGQNLLGKALNDAQQIIIERINS